MTTPNPAVGKPPAKSSRWQERKEQALQYLRLNLIQFAFFLIFRVFNFLKIRHKERITLPQPGDLYVGWHDAIAPDGGMIGQVWFPASLKPSVQKMLPWVLVTAKHLSPTGRQTAAKFNCILVVQSTEDTEERNSRADLLSIKRQLARGPLIYFPSGTRVSNQSVPTGDPAAGSLARVREVRRIIPFGMRNTVQPFRYDSSEPSLTMWRWWEWVLRRLATQQNTIGKIARIWIEADWAFGFRWFTRPVLTHGNPIMPDELRSGAEALKAQREAAGQKTKLNQCFADYLVMEVQRLRDEP